MPGQVDAEHILPETVDDEEGNAGREAQPEAAADARIGQDPAGQGDAEQRQVQPAQRQQEAVRVGQQRVTRRDVDPENGQQLHPAPAQPLPVAPVGGMQQEKQVDQPDGDIGRGGSGQHQRRNEDGKPGGRALDAGENVLHGARPSGGKVWVQANPLSFPANNRDKPQTAFGMPHTRTYVREKH